MNKENDVEFLRCFFYNSSSQKDNNVQVIAAALKAAEESPCSHGAEMPVVFVPGETISQGSSAFAGLTAGKYLSPLKGYGMITLKVPQ